MIDQIPVTAMQAAGLDTEQLAKVPSSTDPSGTWLYVVDDQHVVALGGDQYDPDHLYWRAFNMMGMLGSPDPLYHGVHPNTEAGLLTMLTDIRNYEWEITGE